MHMGRQNFAAFEDLPPKEGSGGGDSSGERDVGHMGTLDEEQYDTGYRATIGPCLRQT